MVSSFCDRVVIVPTHHPWLQGELASGNVGATRTGLCVPVRSPRASVHVCMQTVQRTPPEFSFLLEANTGMLNSYTLS